MCSVWNVPRHRATVILPYDDDDLSAAGWLRDIELRWPATVEERSRLPLFCDRKGGAFVAAKFDRLIRQSIARVLGEQRARAYTPHSWRVWLAYILRMAGASDAQMQAFGRWLNPQKSQGLRAALGRGVQQLDGQN